MSTRTPKAKPIAERIGVNHRVTFKDRNGKRWVGTVIELEAPDLVHVYVDMCTYRLPAASCTIVEIAPAWQTGTQLVQPWFLIPELGELHAGDRVFVDAQKLEIIAKGVELMRDSQRNTGAVIDLDDVLTVIRAALPT